MSDKDSERAKRGKKEFVKKVRQEIQSTLDGIIPPSDVPHYPLPSVFKLLPPEPPYDEGTEPDEWEQKRQEAKVIRRANRISKRELRAFQDWDKPNKRQVLNRVLVPPLVKYLQMPPEAPEPPELYEARVTAQAQIEIAILQYQFEYKGIKDQRLHSALQNQPTLYIDYKMRRDLEKEYSLRPIDIQPNFEMELAPELGLKPIGIPIDIERAVRQKHISTEAKARQLADVLYDLSVRRAYEFITLKVALAEGDEETSDSDTRDERISRWNDLLAKTKGSPFSALLEQLALDRGYSPAEVENFARRYKQP